MSRVSRYLLKECGLPVVDLVKKTHQVATYHQLMQTQWLSHERLLDIALGKLRQLLVHADLNVDYYHRVFESRDFDPHRIQSFEDLRRLPVLTKQDVRENHSAIVARNASDFEPRNKSTSGSTGQPLPYLASRESHSVVWASNWRAFSVLDFTPGDRIAALSGGALMPYTLSFKHRVYALCMGLVQLPAYHLNDGELSSYVRTLRKEKDIKYLFSYASAAYLLARYLQAHSIDDIHLRAIFTTSEVLSPLQRQTIEHAFNCPVFDTYGNNEAGIYAFECEQCNGLHYGLENAYLEVLDENDSPVEPGEIGRLVATNLSNYAMPIIRYDTGDLGSVEPGTCKCGRGLPRISKILGRSRDFVTTPDGRHVHGAFFNHFKPFYETPWIASWHVLQDETDHLTITLRPDGVPREEDIGTIRSLLSKALGSDFRIDIHIDDTLFITPAGKLKLVQSLVPVD